LDFEVLSVGNDFLWENIPCELILIQSQFDEMQNSN